MAVGRYKVTLSTKSKLKNKYMKTIWKGKRNENM